MLAPPRAVIVIPQRVTSVSWACRPRRIDECVVNFLLHSLHQRVRTSGQLRAHDEGGSVEHDLPIRFAKCGHDIAFEQRYGAGERVSHRTLPANQPPRIPRPRVVERHEDGMPALAPLRARRETTRSSAYYRPSRSWPLVAPTANRVSAAAFPSMTTPALRAS